MLFMLGELMARQSKIMLMFLVFVVVSPWLKLLSMVMYLTPGRYVGAEAVEDDDESLHGKNAALTEKLGEQMAKGAELDVINS